MLNLLCNLYTTIDNFLCIFKGTVKEPACKDYVKVCLLSCILTFNNLFSKQSQPCILSPTKALLKEIFSGVVLNTSATVAQTYVLSKSYLWTIFKQKSPKLRNLTFTKASPKNMNLVASRWLALEFYSLDIYSSETLAKYLLHCI